VAGRGSRSAGEIGSANGAGSRSGNAEGHSVLGVLEGNLRLRLGIGRTTTPQGHRSGTGPPLVRYRYAQLYLLPMMRFQEAKEQCRPALGNDPVSMFNHFGMAWSMYAAQEYQAAIEYARSALEIDPNFPFLCGAMGLAQLSLGCLQEAMASFQRSYEFSAQALRCADVSGRGIRSGRRSGAQPGMADEALPLASEDGRRALLHARR